MCLFHEERNINPASSASYCKRHAPSGNVGVNLPALHGMWPSAISFASVAAVYVRSCTQMMVARWAGSSRLFSALSNACV